MNRKFDLAAPRRRFGLRLAAGLAPLLAAGLVGGAEHGERPGERPVAVDRVNHGSIRHVDTHVVSRPVEVRHEAVVRPEVVVHRDVDVDVHRRHFWNDFAFGRRLASLPLGFLTLQIGGVPYYYADGVYYQPVNGVFEEVYPPVGAVIPQPPNGAILIQAGGLNYYYAGGAFYLLQPNGTYAIAPTPIGVIVPELPPGAIQVSVNGAVAYQFNGIYYEPVFVNGVTQYQTFVP